MERTCSTRVIPGARIKTPGKDEDVSIEVDPTSEETSCFFKMTSVSKLFTCVP